MKSNHTKSRCHAMSLFEVFLVVAILMSLAVLLLPAWLAHRRYPRANPVMCVNNLKQVGLAYRVWEGDNNDKYPMMVSVTNGGTMELVNTDPEFVRDTFLSMSNELSTPKILHCPDDVDRQASSNAWSAFTSTNISYFIGVDATDSQPQMILSGDDNVSVDGTTLKSGLHDLSTNAVIAWTKDRHQNYGYIGLADGSVQQLTTSQLQQTFQSTGIATNRLAFP